MMKILLITVFATTPAANIIGTGDCENSSAATSKENPTLVSNDSFEAEFASMKAANQEQIQLTKEWREKQGEQRNKLDAFALAQNTVIAKKNNPMNSLV